MHLVDDKVQYVYDTLHKVMFYFNGSPTFTGTVTVWRTGGETGTSGCWVLIDVLINKCLFPAGGGVGRGWGVGRGLPGLDEW